MIARETLSPRQPFLQAMRGSESSGVAPGVGRPAVDISGVGSSRHLSSAEAGGELRPLEPGVGSSRHLSSAEVGGELRPLEQMPRWWGGNYVSSSAHILHPHTDLARRVWRATVRAGDVVVDATAGNGHDTLTLVHELAAAGGGTLWACDIQEAAIASAQARLRAELLSPDWQIVSGDDLHLVGDERDAPGPDAWELHSDEAIVTVEWRVGDHVHVLRHLGSISDSISLRLVVFNLGYLPGADKSLVTTAEGTLEAIAHAEKALAVGGTVSVTIYPGHEEGGASSQSPFSHTQKTHSHNPHPQSPSLRPMSE